MIQDAAKVSSAESRSAQPAGQTDDFQQQTFTFGDRHWRVRGLDKQLSGARLKVNLMVTRRELVHVDSLDLYTSRLRRMFVKEAAAELLVEQATIKKDIGRVLLELESLQDTLTRKAFSQQETEVPVMTDAKGPLMAGGAPTRIATPH